MAFFEPVDAPLPTFDRDRGPTSWEEGFGQTVFNEMEVAGVQTVLSS